eukprot:CAMPEP_0204541588 /NCGR_PEP_ID=MMETSP0661-20131031/18344_1 /ASSEMBLY_ACC=CAM_ASM_000606 /TAXON_ID=109239 /ORGANISM="Alexandrium margalefi, Strain AMGDE01CS-322" /LENGTH=191 /DNA_ID=CAMNT_0051548277 /DNA_START=24 /DNA_END=596 /DNA_ORIENTATION=-
MKSAQAAGSRRGRRCPGHGPSRRQAPPRHQALDLLGLQTSGGAEPLARHGLLAGVVPPRLDGHALRPREAEDLPQPPVGHLGGHGLVGGPVPELVLLLDVVMGNGPRGVRGENHDARHSRPMVLALWPCVHHAVADLHGVTGVEAGASVHHAAVELGHGQNERRAALQQRREVRRPCMPRVQAQGLKRLHR